MSQLSDLLLLNARVLTQDARLPHAEAVALRGETIFAVGKNSVLSNLRGLQTRIIDCQGMPLMPGLVDAHCHLLAAAGSWQSVDCSPDSVSSIGDIRRAIRERACVTSKGEWVRGFGYDDLSLAEGRHPTRWDLDEVAPDQPVRLDHRSRHASVLNSIGLGKAGIHRDTPDPVEGVIDRDEATGEPTGLLLEMNDFLRQRLGSLRDEEAFYKGIDYLNQRLLSYGITSVQDAGPGNGLRRWETFRELKTSGRLAPRLTMMVGFPHIREFREAGWSFGDGDDDLRLGPAKLMVTLTTGSLQPGQPELAEMIAEAWEGGFSVAIHAVEKEAVVAATAALRAAHQSLVPLFGKGGSGGIAPRDRIEHCAECTPELVAQVKQCGAMVVTQPGFIYWNGDRYRQRVRSELLPHLYPIGALARAGVPLAFGSDAPVIDPNPWPGIGSAVTRATRAGQVLGFAGEIGGLPLPSGDLKVETALQMYTLGGAVADGAGARKGSIRPGNLADLVLLDADPTTVAPDQIKGIKAVLTVVDGKVVWGGGDLSF